MTLDLNFQDLKQIAPHGRVVKDGITLVVGRPLIPDVKTDAPGNARGSTIHGRRDAV
jgi:hypothetical protein